MLKRVDFGPKIDPILPFWTKQKFSLEIRNTRFERLFHACHLVQFQKNLMNRCGEKFRSVDFGPKNFPFCPFYAKQEFFSEKKAPSRFSVY